MSTYKLKENATIALIGGHTLPPEKPFTSTLAPKSKSSIPQTEEGTISAIRAELERVRETLIPDVDALVRALTSSYGEGATTEAEVEVPLSKSIVTVPPMPTPVDHSRLSELLLQSLLRLDALVMAGVDWPEARVQRKAAVREVQGALDRLDAAWATR